MIKRCGCFDAYYPADNASAFDYVTVPVCSVTNITQGRLFSSRHLSSLFYLRPDSSNQSISTCSTFNNTNTRKCAILLKIGAYFMGTMSAIAISHTAKKVAGRCQVVLRGILLCHFLKQSNESIFACTQPKCAVKIANVSLCK